MSDRKPTSASWANSSDGLQPEFCSRCPLATRLSAGIGWLAARAPTRRAWCSRVSRRGTVADSRSTFWAGRVRMNRNRLSTVCLAVRELDWHFYPVLLCDRDDFLEL